MRLKVFFRLCLLCLTMAAASEAWAQSYTTVVVFGDSLSDTGNFAQQTNAQFAVRYPSASFNYADGRFTDGAATLPAARGYSGVWVEQFAATFAAKPAVKASNDGGTNYAYGEATTANGTRTVPLPQGLSIVIPNMGQQVANYLATRPAPTPSTLYVLFGGSNDLFADPSTTGVTTAAQQEASLVQQLVNAGGTDFLVPNVPPLGSTPQFNGTSAAAGLNAAAALFRTLLAVDLQAVGAAAAAQGKTIRIYQPDLYTLETGIGAAPYNYGFANVTASAQGLAATIDPDTYAFWDTVHPTTAGHSFIAGLARTQFNKATATTTTLSVSPTQIAAGQSVTLQATVAAAGAPTMPTGSVTFFSGTGAGSVALGADALNAGGIASATVTPPATGSPYTITAVYEGDAVFTVSASAPQTLTVLASAVPTATTLIASATTVTPGTPVSLTASVTSSNGTPPGMVTFTAGTTQLGSGTLNAAGSYTLTTSALPTGSNFVTATFAANGIYAGSTSSALTVIVGNPAISVGVSPASLTITHGSSGTAQITLTPVAGGSGTAVLSCGTVPAHLSCSFSPATLALSGTTSQTSTLTIGTTASATLSMPTLPWRTAPWTMVYAACLLPLAGLGIPRRRRAGFQPGLLALLLTATLTALAGCGSSSGPASTAPGTYSVTVNSTVSGNPALNSSSTLNVLVQ